MRIGLFLDDNQDISSLSQLFSEFGSEVVGYSSSRPHNSLSGKYLFQPYPLELLAGCDVAIVFSKELFINDIPREAIRRGIHLYLADLPSYSKAILNEILCLRQEIDVYVDFGYSGFNLIDKLPNPQALNGQVFLDCRRGMPFDTSHAEMQRVLLFDLATLLRSNNGLIKKNRVFSLPSSTYEFNLINIRLEYANGSVSCYTLNRLNSDEDFDLAFYGNLPSDSFHLSWKGKTFTNKIISHTLSFVDFISLIKAKGKPIFSIDQALALNSLINDILEKVTLNK